MNKTKEQLIKEMNEHGYFYDEIDSYEGYLKFYYTTGVLPMSFDSWSEVEEWLTQVVED